MMTYQDEIEEIIHAESSRRIKEFMQTFDDISASTWFGSTSELFKTLRGNRTMREMSQITGVSVSYWNDIEKARTEPTLAKIREVAECLGQAFAIVIYKESK